MRLAFALVLALLLQACGAQKIPRLSPRDARLPTEAARWLADAEDQVEIARAHLDDAKIARTDARTYAGELANRAAQMGGLTAEVATVNQARQDLRSVEFDAARRKLDLASSRLLLTRAETAMRHDLAVYELEPLIAEVKSRTGRVAEAERLVEEQRALVEQSSDALWHAYGAWVTGGGSTNALWGSR